MNKVEAMELLEQGKVITNVTWEDTDAVVKAGEKYVLLEPREGATGKYQVLNMAALDFVCFQLEDGYEVKELDCELPDDISEEQKSAIIAMTNLIDALLK